MAPSTARRRPISAKARSARARLCSTSDLALALSAPVTATKTPTVTTKRIPAAARPIFIRCIESLVVRRRWGKERRHGLSQRNAARIISTAPATSQVTRGGFEVFRPMPGVGNSQKIDPTETTAYM